MASMSQGTFAPVQAQLTLEHPIFSSFPVRANIQHIELFAGAAYGSAVVTYPSEAADNTTRQMGSKAVIRIGGVPVFRGIVARGPFSVSPDSDEVKIAMICDKWLLRGRRIGQYGIGTQGEPAGTEGFKDVAFEVIFNRDGKPNKAPGALEFNTGSTAIYWTLKDCMRFIFAHYVPDSVATLDAGVLNHDSYTRTPSHLTLLGQTACQAIDTVAELAGESWALVAGNSASEFRCVYPGAGTARIVRLFAAHGRAQATAATEAHATESNVPLTVENCVDKYQARSAHIVKETTYKSYGTYALLKRSTTFKSKKYVTRFEVDVSKYEDNGLGKNLSAGSTAKPWLSNLCTRINTAGDWGLTAYELQTTPALLKNKPFDLTLWISEDATVDAPVWKICTGGFRVDTKYGKVDIESKIEVRRDKGDGTRELEIKDWTKAGIAMTVATVLELQEVVESTPAAYLAEPVTEIIEKSDLVPERRQNIWLPNLSSTDPHMILKLISEDGTTEEKYVDVTARLTEAVTSAIARTPKVETPIDLTMDFFPIWQIGDRITIQGRNTGATGDEVIIALAFNVHEAFVTKIQASNVMKAVDPDKFIARRPR